MIIRVFKGWRAAERSKGGGRDCEGKEGNAIFLGQADGGRGCIDGGSESAVQMDERNLEVDGVAGSIRLDGVFFENGVLPRDMFSMEDLGLRTS